MILVDLFFYVHCSVPIHGLQPINRRATAISVSAVYDRM